MNLKKAAQKKLRKSGGFTLVEMLIVVAIIAILVVVSIPMVSNALDKAKTATDDANMRAAKAAAMIQYMTDSKTEAVTYYYDAASGKVMTSSATTIEGYNQKDQGTGGATIGEKTGCVQVTVTAGGIIEETGVKWVVTTSVPSPSTEP